MPKQIRVCLVGAGRVARVHAKSLVNHVADGILVAVVDPFEVNLKITADQYGVDKRFGTLKQALDSVEFEAVVITTPTFTHADLAVTAARAGKHVLLEKPMALTLEECDDIITAAQENKVLLQLGFMRRFDPEFTAAAKRIIGGEIGQPMMIKSLTHGPGLPPPWARDLKTSNGNLAEVNSHDWDCTRWLMGSDYERVYVEVANFKGAARGVDTENYYDNSLVNIKFKNGGLGSISCVCPCDYGYDARVEIIGEKGIMQIGELKGEAIVVCTDRDQGLITPIFRTWPQRFEWAYIREMEHYVKCIQTGSQPKVGGEEGRWAVAGVLAGTKSMLEERPVLLSEFL
ncbi:MAG: Gfo/Idh/MocA family oxidoreductase [Anaerolineales bacterium]|nr:Gfo/Idh/MocA family oxidoreductase [Anaerolineales bacterium]